jgi:tRNA-binding EMAP/Myf-like protein
MINIQQFGEVEIRVGEVMEATDVEKSEKLIRLRVNFNEFERIIFTGVRTYGYTAADFAGKRFLFVTNLEYRKMPSYVETPAGKMAEESQGMILAVDGLELPFGEHGAAKPLFISAEGLPVGAKVR